MGSASFWSRGRPLRPAFDAGRGHAPAGSDRPPTLRWPWAAACLGALAALVLCLPAAWLAGLAAQATGGRVQLLQARGTVWDGSAVLVLTGGADSRDARALPGRLNWRLRPALGGLTAAVDHACCLPTPLHLDLRPGWASLRVDVLPEAGAAERLVGQWPASLLIGLGTPWNTLQPGGALRLSTRDLSLQWAAGRFAITGQAVVELVDLSSRLSTLPRLGTYRIVIAGGGTSGPSQVSLSTRDGALQLSGAGSWSASGLRLRGEASAAPGDEVALANLLNIIGRRSGERSLISIG